MGTPSCSREDFETTLALIGYEHDPFFGSYFAQTPPSVLYWYYREPYSVATACRCLVRVFDDRAEIYAMTKGKMFNPNMTPTWQGPIEGAMAWVKDWHTKPGRT